MCLCTGRHRGINFQPEKTRRKAVIYVLKHLSERSRTCWLQVQCKRPVWARLHRSTSCPVLVGYPRAKGCVHVLTIKLQKTNIFKCYSLNIYCIYVTLRDKLDKHTMLTVRPCIRLKATLLKVFWKMGDPIDSNGSEASAIGCPVPRCRCI